LAFLEDHIRTLQIGSLVFRVLGPTFRCVIPTVDQTTGEAGFRQNRSKSSTNNSLRQAEPIATLKQFRSGGLRHGWTGFAPVTMGGSQSLAPLFGIYLGTEESDAMGKVVSVGDPIRILEYKKTTSDNNFGFLSKLSNAVTVALGWEKKEGEIENHGAVITEDCK